MSSHDLTPEQLEFFDTFGFLALPGALADSIAEITAAFDEIWATRGDGHDGKAHDPTQRSCIVPFIDQHERLCALLEEPCIYGLLCSLLGNNFNYMGSDGNYYAGDTVWHSDGWHPAVLRYVKIALYLDPLTRETGCLRVIPGSHNTGDTYSGEWKNDEKHGRGIYTYADGGRYEGEYKDGKWHGMGMQIFADGEKYEGEFKEGNYHGRGEYIFSDGSEYEGEFKDGDVWTGIRTNADGSKTEWKDGDII